MTGVGNSVFSSARAKRMEEALKRRDRAMAVAFVAPDRTSVEIGTGAAAAALFRLMAGHPSGLPLSALSVMAKLDPDLSYSDLEQALVLEARGEWPTKEEI